MNRPYKSGIAALKLPKLDRRLPTLEEICLFLSESQKTPGRAVEQPFAVGKPLYTYCLTCLVENPGEIPKWSLFQGDGPSGDSLWSHQTGDAGLVRNFILKECPEEGDSRQSQSTTFGPTAQTAAISLTRLHAMQAAKEPPREAGGSQEPQGYFKSHSHPGHNIQEAKVEARTEAKEELEKKAQEMSPEPATGSANGSYGSPVNAGTGYNNVNNGVNNSGNNGGNGNSSLASGSNPALGAYPRTPSGGLLNSNEVGTVSGSRPPISAWGVSPQAGALIGNKIENLPLPSDQTAAVVPPTAVTRPEIKMTYGVEQTDTANYHSSILPKSFTNPPPYTKRPPTLEGALTDMTPPSLLQSMQIGKMTGVLMVVSNEDMVEVYFEEGAPVHAIAPDSKGEAAVMELLTWDIGKFAFYPNERTTEKSIRRRMEGMLMESAPLTDQYRYLHEVGLTMDSYVIRRHGPISEAEFEQRMERGARMDMAKQKQFYQLIDNKSTLFDLLRKMPMPKVEWIPTLYNLICCDLVAPASSHKRDATIPSLESLGVDRAPIERALRALKHPETGLYDYPVIWHFIEQEYCRHEHTNSPFCLIMFEMRYRTQNGLELLPPQAVQEAAKRIDTVKRNIDILAHFEPPTFILLLPATQVSAATLVAKRLCDILWDSSLGGNLDTRSLALAFGVAGLPEENLDLAGLLNQARESLNQSKRSGSPVVSAGKKA